MAADNFVDRSQDSRCCFGMFREKITMSLDPIRKIGEQGGIRGRQGYVNVRQVTLARVSSAENFITKTHISTYS